MTLHRVMAVVIYPTIAQADIRRPLKAAPNPCRRSDAAWPAASIRCRRLRLCRPIRSVAFIVRFQQIQSFPTSEPTLQR